jgi:hypothetical protein
MDKIVSNYFSFISLVLLTGFLSVSLSKYRVKFTRFTLRLDLIPIICFYAWLLLEVLGNPFNPVHIFWCSVFLLSFTEFL